MTRKNGLKRIDYKSCNEFLDTFSKFNGSNLFPMIQHYLDYDECYKADFWIEYSVYFKDFEPIGIIAKKKYDDIFDGMVNFISLLEVNSDYRNMGYGSKILNDYMLKNKPYVLFYSDDNVCGFYEKLGFEKISVYKKGFVINKLMGKNIDDVVNWKIKFWSR